MVSGLQAVGALKGGQLLTLNLGGVTAAHGNFKQKLCKRDVFPVEVRGVALAAK
jgi:hypothetical protein